MALSRHDESISLTDETIRRVEANGDEMYMPELLRVKGTMLLAQARHNRDEAEGHLAKSLELSRIHGSRAWELRTATDLAALCADQGRAGDARALLLPVLEQFTEGWDTADLRAAKLLLANIE